MSRLVDGVVSGAPGIIQQILFFLFPVVKWVFGILAVIVAIFIAFMILFGPVMMDLGEKEEKQSQTEWIIFNIFARIIIALVWWGFLFGIIMLGWWIGS